MGLKGGKWKKGLWCFSEKVTKSHKSGSVAVDRLDFLRFRYKFDAVSLPISLSLDYRGLFETTTWMSDPVLLTCSGNVADLFPTYPLTTWLWMDNTRHSIIADLGLKKHLTDSLYPKAVLKIRAAWSKLKLSMWGIRPALKDSSCAVESHLRLFFSSGS